MRSPTPLLLALCLLAAACTTRRPAYRIGVSQCSEDVWRMKQNGELRMGAYLHDDVELLFATAHDDDSLQIRQIDSLVAAGIDLLIVSPNQVGALGPTLDRIMQAGTPVIMFERKTAEQHYTAFVSADNREMGREIGRYMARRLGGRGTVLVVAGLAGSSPTLERLNGFCEALKDYPEIHILDTLQGDWTEERAYQATRAWLTSTGSAPPQSMPSSA